MYAYQQASSIFWVIRTSVVLTAALRATGCVEKNEMRRPDHRTLCAMARAELEADRTIDDAEWKERMKCRLVSQGWAYPTPAAISAALAAIEHVLVKAWGPRP